MTRPGFDGIPEWCEYLFRKDRRIWPWPRHHRVLRPRVWALGLGPIYLASKNSKIGIRHKSQIRLLVVIVIDTYINGFGRASAIREKAKGIHFYLFVAWWTTQVDHVTEELVMWLLFDDVMLSLVSYTTRNIFIRTRNRIKNQVTSVWTLNRQPTGGFYLDKHQTLIQFRETEWHLSKNSTFLKCNVNFECIHFRGETRLLDDKQDQVYDAEIRVSSINSTLKIKLIFTSHVIYPTHPSPVAVRLSVHSKAATTLGPSIGSRRIQKSNF